MKNDPLKNLHIATPCTASWDAMAGDERVRHCTLCSLNVYNFQEMTRDEIRALLVEKEGRVCARMYRRADGTLLTRDCPSAFQVVRQRMSRIAAAVTAALFSVAAFASDGATCVKPLVKKDGSKVKLRTEQVATAQQAGLSGIVRDEDGNPIPGVTVTLRNEATKRELSIATDVKGSFTLTSLSDGLYHLDVTLSGLKPAVVDHLLLKQDTITRARVALRVDDAMGAITVGGVGPDLTMTDFGVTTTFTQNQVSKLPH